MFHGFPFNISIPCLDFLTNWSLSYYTEILWFCHMLGCWFNLYTLGKFSHWILSVHLLFHCQLSYVFWFSILLVLKIEYKLTSLVWTETYLFWELKLLYSVKSKISSYVIEWRFSVLLMDQGFQTLVYYSWFDSSSFEFSSSS